MDFEICSFSLKSILKMRASTVEIADLQEIINLIDGKTRGVYSHKRCQSKFNF